jgi:hypothetical protein
MHIKKIKNLFDKKPSSKFDNNWKTSKYMFNHPQLHLISAPRGTGKTYLMSKIILAGIAENLYDRIFLISPTAQSNLKQLEDLNIAEEDVFEPTIDAIQKVIELVEEERDEYQSYLNEKELYDYIINDTANNFTDSDLMVIDRIMINEELVEPKYKRPNPRRPQCIVILDDVLNSPVMSTASSINKLFTINRHLGAMEGGGACGLGVIMLTQTYRCGNGKGVSRQLRESLTELTIFKTKSDTQMSTMISEFGGAIDVDKFKQAYDAAIKDDYDNLTISFGKLDCPTFRFRRNLSEFICFDDDKTKCVCKK